MMSELCGCLVFRIGRKMKGMSCQFRVIAVKGVTEFTKRGLII